MQNTNESARLNGNCRYCERFVHKEVDCRIKARDNGNNRGGYTNRGYNSSNNRHDLTTPGKELIKVGIPIEIFSEFS